MLLFNISDAKNLIFSHWNSASPSAEQSVTLGRSLQRHSCEWLQEKQPTVLSVSLTGGQDNWSIVERWNDSLTSDWRGQIKQKQQKCSQQWRRTWCWFRFCLLKHYFTKNMSFVVSGTKTHRLCTCVLDGECLCSADRARGPRSRRREGGAEDGWELGGAEFGVSFPYAAQEGHRGRGDEACCQGNQTAKRYRLHCISLFFVFFFWQWTCKETSEMMNYVF